MILHDAQKPNAYEVGERIRIRVEKQERVLESGLEKLTVSIGAACFPSKELGLSFQEYLLRTRIRKAMGLLESGSKSIKEVGYEVGYCRPEHFSKVFRREVAPFSTGHGKC